MRVSVIIPTVNKTPYLCEAVESVLKQTCPAFEIIVIDDAAEVPVEKTLASYRSKVKIVRPEKPVGVSRARNIGIQESRGDLVAQIDDDDLWLPQYLERNVAVFQSDSEIGMVGSYIAEWDISKNEMVRPVWKGPRGYATVRDIFDYSWPRPSGVMFRKDAFLSIGGYDPSYTGYEDADIYFRMAKRFRSYFIAEELVHYRIHPASASHKELMMAKSGVQFWSRLLQSKPETIPAYLIGRRLSRQYYRAARAAVATDQWKEAFRHTAKALYFCPSVGLLFPTKRSDLFSKAAQYLKPYVALCGLGIANLFGGGSVCKWVKPKEEKTVSV